MKTMECVSSARSTKKTPTEEFDLVFLSGGTGSISA